MKKPCLFGKCDEMKFLEVKNGELEEIIKNKTGLPPNFIDKIRDLMVEEKSSAGTSYNQALLDLIEYLKTGSKPVIIPFSGAERHDTKSFGRRQWWKGFTTGIIMLGFAVIIFL